MSLSALSIANSYYFARPTHSELSGLVNRNPRHRVTTPNHADPSDTNLERSLLDRWRNRFPMAAREQVVELASLAIGKA